MTAGAVGIESGPARVADAGRFARLGRVPLLAGCVLASIVSRALALVAPPLSDEAVHLIGSWTVLARQRLYLDFVDNKPPLLYWFYAFSQVIFGRGLASVRLMTVVLVVPLTAYAGSAFYAHSRAGVVAAVLFIVTSVSFGLEDSLAVNTEILMLLPAAWAFVLLRTRDARTAPRDVAAGMLLGVAPLFKVTALFWVAGTIVWIFVAADGRSRRDRTLRSFVVLAGCAVAVVACVVVLASQGSAVEAIYWVVLRNVAYVTAPIGAREAFIRAMRGSLAWALCTWPLWWFAWRSRALVRTEPAIGFALMLVICGVPAALVGLRLFGHYYIQVLFPLCLAAAPAVAAMSRHTLRRSAVAAAAFTIVMCLAWTAANAWMMSRNDIIEARRPVFRHVTERLRLDACFEDGTMFVWGIAPAFYTYSGLTPATRFVLPQETISGYVPGRSADAASPRRFADIGADWDRLLTDLESSRATFILDTAPSGLHFWARYPLSRFPTFENYVREHYDTVAVVDRVVIYRRKGCEER
jgi:hypothetical protein